MKDILINVLFLLAVLLIAQLFSVKTNTMSQKARAYFTFFSSLISIVFCMSFPIQLSGEYQYDIRAVPFILGSLYGGPAVSAGLYVSIIIYRFILSTDLSFLGTVFNYALLGVLLLFLSKRFIHFDIRKKLIFSVVIILFHMAVSRFIYDVLFPSHLLLTIFLQVSLIKLTTIILIILTTEKIRQNEQLRRKMIDIEKFELVNHLSASIAHEIRNGLTGASGFMQLLNKLESNSKKSQYIGKALEEMKRTENIIRDFLTFAKPASGRVQEINLQYLIDHSLDIIEPYANMNSVIIQKNLSPFWIRGDKKLVQQSFLNIFKNAVESMPGGGKLEINMVKNATGHVISIQDTGIGMTPEQIKRLGQPYFTTKGKGTGLGTMVSYRVIKELNGTIQVSSKIGKGTIFSIYLPQSK